MRVDNILSIISVYKELGQLLQIQISSSQKKDLRLCTKGVSLSDWFCSSRLEYRTMDGESWAVYIPLLELQKRPGLSNWFLKHIWHSVSIIKQSPRLSRDLVKKVIGEWACEKGPIE